MACDALVAGPVALVVGVADYDVALGLASGRAGGVAYGAVVDLGAPVAAVSVVVARRTHGEQSNKYRNATNWG